MVAGERCAGEIGRSSRETVMTLAPEDQEARSAGLQAQHPLKALVSAY